MDFFSGDFFSGDGLSNYFELGLQRLSERYTDSELGSIDVGKQDTATDLESIEFCFDQLPNDLSIAAAKIQVSNSILANAGNEVIEQRFSTAHRFAAALILPGFDSLAFSSGTDLLTSASGPQMLANVFKLHSKADAKHVIYLDFNGHTTSKTFWNDQYNSGKAFTTKAFSTDASSSFSAAEQELILDIWRRVSEDFRPFNVNVTTAEPAANRLMKTSATDSYWGVRVVIGGSSTQWLGGNSAGIALEDSFNFDADVPAFIFSEQFHITDKNVAEAITHEVGHTLGLDHDGNASTDYYQGHGSGDTGWAPIMGVGYYQTLTQWSKGEYTGANNKQDDLRIITTQNGFGYRDDDHGNTYQTSSLLRLNNNRYSGYGVIELHSDLDFFTFGIQSNDTYQINVMSFFKGPNLDVRVYLYNQSGTYIGGFNPVDSISVTQAVSLKVGKYHLRVDGVGKSGADGYSDYGSLGAYTVAIIPKTSTIVTPDIQIYQNSAAKEEGTGGYKNFTFRLIRQGNLKIESTVDWIVSGTSDRNTVDRFDFRGDVFASGTAKFEFGSHITFISVVVNSDNVWEPHERMKVTISNAFNGNITKASVIGTIFNDDNYGSALILPESDGGESDEAQSYGVAALQRESSPSLRLPIESQPLLEGAFTSKTDQPEAFAVGLAAEYSKPDFNALVSSDNADGVFANVAIV